MKLCAACNEAFKPARPSSNYCSRPCARTKNGGHNRKPEGWWRTPRGYIAGYVWIDGKKTRKCQHRWVVERHIGRELLPHEDVHHINGVKDDNRLENLQVISHEEHSHLSNVGRIVKSGHKLRLSREERQRRADAAKARKLWTYGHAALAAVGIARDANGKFSETRP